MFDGTPVGYLIGGGLIVIALGMVLLLWGTNHFEM